MADKIVVMRDGIVEQIGDPLDALRPAGQHVRRRVHRLAGDEHDSRHRRASAAAARARGLRRRRDAADARRRPRRRRPARCSTASVPSIARVGAGGGLPVDVVVVEPTGADTQLYCRFNGQRSHGDGARSRRDRRAGERDCARARSAARPCFRRGERRRARRMTFQPRHNDMTERITKEECMSDVKRRDFLKATAGVAAGSALPAARHCLRRRGGRAGNTRSQPEKGAKLRVLRWKRFVQGDEDVWAANTEEVHRDDRASKCASTPKAGKTCGRRRRSRPTSAAVPTSSSARWRTRTSIPTSSSTSPISPTTSATSTAAGTTRPARTAMHGKNRWVAIMMGAAGNALVYRESTVKAAGFDAFPKDMAGFLKLCQALKAKGTPPGFALGNATGDSSWTHWLVWAHGGKLVDAKNNVVINSPETIAALEYCEAALRDVHPGHAVVARPEQQQGVPRRPDRRSRTTASRSTTRRRRRRTRSCRKWRTDIQHATFPLGLDGKSRELNLVFPMMIFKYTKYPNAAKEYLRFMMEKEQYVPWQEASIGYVCHPLAAYESSAVLDGGPEEDAVPRLHEEHDAERLRGRARATRRRRASPTSSSRTWSRRRRRARRRRRKRRSGRRSGRSATTRYDVAPCKRFGRSRDAARRHTCAR